MRGFVKVTNSVSRTERRVAPPLAGGAGSCEDAGTSLVSCASGRSRMRRCACTPTPPRMTAGTMNAARKSLPEKATSAPEAAIVSAEPSW